MCKLDYMSDLNVIMGLGKTGLSFARYLTNQGENFVLVDERESPLGLEALKTLAPKVKLYLGKSARSVLDAEFLSQVKQIYLSPGVPLPKVPVPVVGDIEVFAQVAKAPIVAITGTNAKSTVTRLVGQMAENCLPHVITAGNIGLPVLDVLAEPAPDVYVLELSSYQLETCGSLQNHVACILNVTPDHLDRYPNFEAYKRAKYKIYHHAKKIIYNRDDANTWPDNLDNSLSFGLDAPCENQFGIIHKNHQTYLAYGQECLCDVKDLKQQGQHAWLNALAALAIGTAMQLPLNKMLASLKLFDGLPHRLQCVRELKGVRWFNDSKATNIGATVAALSSIAEGTKGKIILIAGGQGKGQDFSALKNALTKKVDTVICLGEDAELIEAVCLKQNVFRVSKLALAVRLAHQLAEAQDTVLLSPACASFDMFKNFEHRGEVFTQCVKELA